MDNEVMLLPLQGEENSLKSEKKVIQPLPGGENEALQYLFSHHLFTVKNGEYEASLKYLFINNNVHLKNTLNKRFLHEVNGKEAVQYWHLKTEIHSKHIRSILLSMQHLFYCPCPFFAHHTLPLLAYYCFLLFW